MTIHSQTAALAPRALRNGFGGRPTALLRIRRSSTLKPWHRIRAYSGWLCIGLPMERGRGHATIPSEAPRILWVQGR